MSDSVPLGSSVIRAASATTPLPTDALVGLSNAYAVDGRVSWHAPSLRGWAPMNCYLLREGDEALLVDTGLTVHRDALLGQLEALLRPQATLSIMSLRLGEFDSMCNMLPLLERFPLDRFFGVMGTGERWGDFLPESLQQRDARVAAHLAQLRGVSIGRESTIDLGGGGTRPIEVFFAPLHLLASHWVYDAATRTLLTNDVFTHLLADDAADPWTLGPGDPDTTTADDVALALVQTRYWWLAGARTDGVRAALASLFDTRPVDAIGPAYGRILRGRSVVERHYSLLDRALANLAAAPPAVLTKRSR